MAIACLFEWSWLSREQYLALLPMLNGSGEFCSVNTCYDGERLIAILVWESEQALDLFRSTFLHKYLARAGISEPSVKTWSLEGVNETHSAVSTRVLDRLFLKNWRAVSRN